jgi:hypothetical protein
LTEIGNRFRFLPGLINDPFLWPADLNEAVWADFEVAVAIATE